MLDTLSSFFNFYIPFNTQIAKLLALLFITILFSSVGSFLNVCIYRIPLKLSIVKPGSFCPKCKTPIKAWHNIPVLSYFFLGGKCRHCKATFSFRYCFVETITAILAVLYFIKNGYALDLNYLKFVFFMCFAVMIFFIDIDHRLILDKHNYTLIIAGLLFALIGATPLFQALIGAGIGFAIFYSIALIYWLIKKQVGLGGGDIKYITAVGMFTGIEGVIFTIFFSSIFGVLFNIINIGKEKEFAYAPYLVAASLLYFFMGDSIIKWYLDMTFHMLTL